jgi:hypothetical protein
MYRLSLSPNIKHREFFQNTNVDLEFDILLKHRIFIIIKNYGANVVLLFHCTVHFFK